MITDEGFKYFIQAPNAATKLKEVLIGNDKQSIVDLNPPHSITNIQSIVTEAGYKYAMNTTNYEALDFHLGLTHQYNLTGYNGTGKSDYYEYGLFGNNDALLYYNINTNKDKTFLTQVKNTFQSGYFDFKIKLNNPIKHNKKAISITSEGVLTDYIVNYEEVPYTTAPNLLSVTPMECLFYSSGNTILLTGDVSTESFDLVTKEALINLEVNLDRTKIGAGGYIIFKSLFCNLKIYLTDPETEQAVDWPLTDGESLVIPLKVYLGEAK